MSSATHRFRGAGDLELAADLLGDVAAPLVVLAHGGGQTRHSWGVFAERLSGLGYRVMNYDARGHGESEWAGEGGYSIDLQADDLVALTAGHDGPIAFVGASMGGMTALFAASQRPALSVGALVLVDIAPSPDPAEVKRIRDFMTGHPDGFASIEEAANAVSAYNPHRPRPKDLSGLGKNLRRRNGRYYWHWDPHFITQQSREHKHSFEDILRRPARPLAFPALLVRGLRSRIVTSDGIDMLRATMPQIEVFDVPETGHMVAGDDNDVFSEGVLGFLARHFPAKGARGGRISEGRP